MPKFNLYYGIEQEQYNLHSQESVELPTLQDAKNEARLCAHDLYMQNPVRDILDIMKEQSIGEREANYLFRIEMFRKTVFHIEEIVEINGELIEVIRHDYR